MSKIVIDAREWASSTGRYIRSLVQNLEKIDDSNQYLVLLKPVDAANWQPTKQNFSITACQFEEFSFGEQLGFKRQLDALRPDLVHFGMAQQPVLYRGKKITTIHDLTTLRFKNPTKNRLVYGFKQKVYSLVIKRAARTSAAIITPSQYVKHDLVQFTGINPKKVSVIYEAAEPIQAPAVAWPELENKRFIMYIGRPTPHKNLVRLLEAFVSLRPAQPDLVLVLAGKLDSNYQLIKSRVVAEGIKNVVFTDHVSEGQLRWLYQHCAAYVFPSLSEGFGLPGLEAMAHGAPVVSSNATCLPEIYGEAAHYFDPRIVGAMAGAINEVLTDKSLRQKLITAGQAQVKKYSWQRTASQTHDLYNRILEAN